MDPSEGGSTGMHMAKVGGAEVQAYQILRCFASNTVVFTGCLPTFANMPL